MAIEQVFTWLAILIWVGFGAVIVLAAWMLAERKRSREQPECNPYAVLLGKPAWRNVNGDYEKYRVVAVSHKGAVAIRKWENESGHGAKWVRKKQVREGYLRFGDDPHDDIEVAR